MRSSEEKALDSINYHMKYNSGETAIVLEDLDFTFTRSQLDHIRKLVG
ncbi:hypothetical protein [Salipaludibacillus neizhouensis]|nr:hypothetical protein [Salipaludibacillus neizhouensis]